jgi:hypothetical protein
MMKTSRLFGNDIRVDGAPTDHFAARERFSNEKQNNGDAGAATKVFGGQSYRRSICAACRKPYRSI